ncbi:helix-turn-helix domain-containing protein [Bacteroides zhangwenhongii]|uniref:Helix-turn-helix domain-containing protein n=1 Tax=Bacteroides zhangwenhongii TaxID=2650157 RepID=A0ABT5HCX2_9BACE|nr:helix-turn-helix domain-containing protein [Bacteroides zhangwenhongii]MDC7138345.1 helix-turn-helix domain-containing protein [Bacteroides zhangwenhongii]
MDKKSMLEAMINHYTNGNKAKFANLLGVSAQTISAWGTRNTFDSELIYTKCVGVSADWLLTGEGSMLCDNKNLESPSLGCIPNVTTISPEQESIIYKMYERKDDENKALIEEIGGLKERTRTLENKLKEYEAMIEELKEHSVGLSNAETASIKQRSLPKKSNAGSLGVPSENI